MKINAANAQETKDYMTVIFSYENHTLIEM